MLNMKILGVIYLVSVLLFTLFGKLTIKGVQDDDIVHKFLGGLLLGLIIDVIIGLPILGILALIS